MMRLMIIYYAAIAVELPVTRQAPHRSRRAEFPHRALQKYSHPQRLYAKPGTNFLLSRRGRFTIWGFTTSNWVNSCLYPSQL